MSYDPKKWGARCNECPRKGQTPVPPEGPKHAHLCWLGQDPGKTEVKRGRPFVGPTGQRLEALWAAGIEKLHTPITRSQVWVTNTCLCLPVTKSAREGRDAALCCAPRLQKELRMLHPEAGILAMGKWAFFAMTGLLKGSGKFQGFHVPLKKLPAMELKKKKPKRTRKK